ncbi:hypothetical protein [Klebsiella pneumoniae]|uniref:hypothetical protein n=1 Tax=Klebsiella pneumoniae TaxID=573 RepID=UPI000813A684|nr:hypothetical protein [Klebsiella pneumoniae]
MDKTTAVIDSPEALGAALCRHVPDMANGFTITTRDSQLQLTITAEDTRPFMVAMERLLQGKIRQIQRGHQGGVLDEGDNQKIAESIRSNGKNLSIADSAESLSRNELVQQITELKKIADEEVAAAMNKAPGMTWFIQCLMMHDDGIMPAENVVRAARQCLKLPTPVAPAFNLLGKLNCRLYRGPHRATASDQEAGD